MKKLIIYPKKSGNTYKVCNYMHDNANVESKFVTDIKKSELSHYDVIILSSGIYGGRVHNNILTWINSIDKNTINTNTKIYLFLTWLGRGKSDKNGFDKVSRLLSDKGLHLEDNYMTCFGKSFIFIRRFHPNVEDFNNVMEWVNKL
ncbi:MAG: hypothetical protein J7K80_01150 [Candidatus Izimaplasma sp.]|nr:hypothetical protein [Candidatus Izimaplasma bacterium]